jgi:hypothetical protein
MPTTQSKDPKEQVDHPRHYNQHPSGIECIEIIEHMPCNLGNAIKYIWRCGLKQSSAPLRDLRSAEWYVRREIDRVKRFPSLSATSSLGEPTDNAWRRLAQRIVHDAPADDLLGSCLDALIRDDLPAVLDRLGRAAVAEAS